jgi:hypothetical protein
MKLRITLIAPAVLLALASLEMNMTPSEHSSTRNAVGIVGAQGCDITIKAENKSNRDLYILLEQSEVRTKQVVAGPWSTLDTKCPKDQMHLEAKASVETTTCQMDLICDLQRQYKFKIVEKSNGKVINTAWVYYPSDDGWAASGTRTVDLGNIGRHFN